MNIPDCREDEYYNQKYLNSVDTVLIKGYDMASDFADTFVNNLDVYVNEFDLDGEDINLVRFLNNHPKIKSMLCGCIKDSFEAYRDMLIVAMIDSMSDEEYERIRKEVDSESD